MDQGVDQAALTFLEQADGRKVARLPTGKVVLVHYDHVAKVHEGERWLVDLEHHELYAVAYPLDRLTAPSPSVPAQAAEARMPDARPVAERPEAVVRETGPAKAFSPPEGRPMPEMFLRPEDRVAIFVDGANMDGASRAAGYHLDFYKVGDFLRAKAAFRAAYYYVADVTATDSMQIRFLDFLSHSGYIVRKKPVKVIEDRETGARIYKANVDTEMVLDMVNTAENYDVAFLLSGDSDFERCVDLLRSRGKRVYVMTSESTMSRELGHIADKPIFFIEDYQDLLRRDGTAKA